MLGEVTNEVRELCVWLRAGKHGDYEKAFAVHAVIRDQLAAKLKLQHAANRDEYHVDAAEVCGLCGSKSDPHWQAEAEKELTWTTSAP